MIHEFAGRLPRIAATAFVAESADIIGDVEIGENASIWFQSVLRGDIEPIRIGANSNIQDGSIVHTMRGSAVVVGDWVTVGHRAILHGCTVESHCLIGMGAVLLNNVRVGEGSIVAAGALIFFVRRGSPERWSASRRLLRRLGLVGLYVFLLSLLSGAAAWNFVLGASAVALIIYVYRQEGRSPQARLMLGAFRLMLLAFVLALLNRPVVTLVENINEPSVLAILVDDTISM